MNSRAVLITIAAFTLAASAMQANAIDRIKITDSELSCIQLYTEIGEMDTLLGTAKDSRDASSSAATTADIASKSTGVAVHAAASAGSYGAAMGLAQAAPFIGLFGNVAKGVAAEKEKAASEEVADAKARKEHLTGLFISKSCKASEFQTKSKPASTAN